MTKLLMLLSFVLLTFSLTKCAKQDVVNPETKEMQMKPNAEMGNSNHQDSINIVDLIAVMTACNESFRIEMSYLQALYDSGSFPDETDKTPKCFIRCVLEGTRIASEEGEYDPAQAALVFGGDDKMDLEKMATDCAKRDESCKCERAYQFKKCLTEKQIQANEKPQ